MKTVKKLWIGIAVLALLSPLGLIIPALFHAHGAWGEWSLQEINRIAGYVPEGMRKLARTWKSPMADYGTGQSRGALPRGVSYIVSAVAGIAVTAGIAYLLARVFGRKKP